MKKALILVLMLSVILTGCTTNITSRPEGEDVDVDQVDIVDKVDIIEFEDEHEETYKELYLLGNGDFNEGSHMGSLEKPIVVNGTITIDNPKKDTEYVVVINEKAVEYGELTINIKGQSKKLSKEELEIIDEIGAYNLYELKEINKYIGVEGIVTNIEGNTIIVEGDSETHFIVSNETKYQDEVEEGDKVRIYYDTTLSVIMIHPPQYGAVAIVKIEEDVNVKLDKFNDDLLSMDGALKLNLENDGKYTDKYLLVKYFETTRSIPPQTMPLEVIIIE